MRHDHDIGTEAFRFCLTFVDSPEIEGGFVDHPNDPGGATNRGITLATFRRVRPEATVEDLKRIDDKTVASIYRDLYWRPARCHRLPLPLALVHFDAAVNHGLGNAARLLQRTLGVVKDGIIGPKTLGAAVTCDPIKAAKRYIGHRRAFYSAIINRRPQMAVFRDGWTRRMDLLRNHVCRLEGRPDRMLYPVGVGPTNAKTDEAEAIPNPPAILDGREAERPPEKADVRSALARVAFVVLTAAGAIAAAIFGG